MAKKPKPLKSAQNLILEDPAAKLFLEAVIDAANSSGQMDIAQDYLFLMMLAQQYQIYDAAMKDIECYGINLTILGDKGQDRITKNPSVTTATEASKAVMAGLKEMGLTPKARAQMNVILAQPKEVNPVLAALKARDEDGDDD